MNFNQNSYIIFFRTQKFMQRLQTKNQTIQVHNNTLLEHATFSCPRTQCCSNFNEEFRGRFYVLFLTYMFKFLNYPTILPRTHSTSYLNPCFRLNKPPQWRFQPTIVGLKTISMYLTTNMKTQCTKYKALKNTPPCRFLGSKG